MHLDMCKSHGEHCQRRQRCRHCSSNFNTWVSSWITAQKSWRLHRNATLLEAMFHPMTKNLVECVCVISKTTFTSLCQVRFIMHQNSIINAESSSNERSWVSWVSPFSVRKSVAPGFSRLQSIGIQWSYLVPIETSSSSVLRKPSQCRITEICSVICLILDSIFKHNFTREYLSIVIRQFSRRSPLLLHYKSTYGFRCTCEISFSNFKEWSSTRMNLFVERYLS